MITTRNSTDVLIIGGGPSGLCLADALSRTSDLRVTVLERDVIGSTWSRSPADLRVLSPWWTNILSLRSLFKHSPFALVNAHCYLEHLLEFVRQRNINVRTGVEITSIRPDGGDWAIVDGTGHLWRTGHLVCATGYFSSPALPGPEYSSDGSIPTIHASEIDDYDRYAKLFSGKSVLVIGKRVTAGQLMVELVGRGVDITLSADTPIRFHRSGAFAHLLDQAYFVYEAARIRLQPSLESNSYPPMEGGRAKELIESGTVRRVDRISMVKDGFAVFRDESRVRFDYLLLATGYKPALGYLSQVCNISSSNGLPQMNGFELVDAPGIFLLGFDNLRNFRSRYLRGIRSDARLLAKTIGRRAKKRNQEKAATS